MRSDCDYIKSVEDYLCETCDALFNDGIVCDKVYNPEERMNRAANVIQVRYGDDDQSGAIVRMEARVIENCDKRSKGVQDAELLRKLAKNGVKLPNGLVIYINVQYINMPQKIIVDTLTTYILSAQLAITII